MTDKDRIESAIRHIQTAVDVDPWAMEIAVEAMQEKISREPRSFSCGQENDLISRRAAIDATWFEPYYTDPLNVLTEVRDRIEQLPSAQPEQRWIPVTLETLPNPNSVVVVCGNKGTWDYGTYRGWYGDIHSWKWKKNTIKHVYWWMYKTDALPEPYRKDGEADDR